MNAVYQKLGLIYKIVYYWGAIIYLKIVTVDLEVNRANDFKVNHMDDFEVNRVDDFEIHHFKFFCIGRW